MRRNWYPCRGCGKEHKNPMSSSICPECGTKERAEREATEIIKAKRQTQPIAHFKCEGCDRVTNDPHEDMRKLKLAGYLSCCPERKMLPYYAHPAPVADLQVKCDRYEQALREIAKEFDLTTSRIKLRNIATSALDMESSG